MAVGALIIWRVLSWVFEGSIGSSLLLTVKMIVEDPRGEVGRRGQFWTA